VINVYFVVKVTSGQERIAANMLQNKIGKEEDSKQIYSIIVVAGMKGYIIVEAEDESIIRGFITRERNIKGILAKPLSEEDVEKLLSVKKSEQTVSKGDFVEFSTGPFKGYKAKVLKVDETKAEMTVELMDVVVPIPITTKINTAKIIQKMKENVQ